MEKKINISIALATYNEEDNLNRCLASVVDWASEIVIVDGGSTDKTLEIANKYRAKIIKTSNPLIFHINKQKALDACIFEWILQLDADEVVTPDLALEIQNIIRMSDEEIVERVVDPKKSRLFQHHQALVEKRDGKTATENDQFAAFFIPRRNYFLGQPMTYSGTYPDGVIRLVRKSKARFPSKSVHEQIQIEGKVGWLYNDLLHFSNQTLKKYFAGADKYTSLLALEIDSSGKNGLTLYFYYVWWKPLVIFLSLLIRYKGILDGWRGFAFDLFSAMHYPIAYFKYLELVKSRDLL